MPPRVIYWKGKVVPAVDTKHVIAELRRTANLSQDEFASRLHVTRQAVSRWETGETVPNNDTLKMISKIFDVSINVLLGQPRKGDLLYEKMEAELIFHTGSHFPPLGIVASDSARELGVKINGHLTEWARGGAEYRDSFLIGNECPRFASGDGKGIIGQSVRGMDLYFLVDIGNYSRTYRMFGQLNRMSPDDHFQDLKRLIQAVGGKAERVTVIMPLLYGGRQHKRNYRESLDCAVALQELSAMGVHGVITFDAHDPQVQNAVPLMGLDNVMPYYQVLKTLLREYPDIDLKNFMLVSPDEGAMQRNMYYSSVLGVPLGMHYKRRDYSRIVNGRNPIVALEYLGEDVCGKTILIADDQIASGDSTISIAYDLRKRGAERVFIAATYALFTDGFARFDAAYEESVIAGVLGTNLTYRPPELLERAWFREVDCAKYIAYIIAALNHSISFAALLDPQMKISALLNKYNKSAE
jgi:ribose-phosphate pyrophosphokinase